jgi:hypothetical protein
MAAHENKDIFERMKTVSLVFLLLLYAAHAYNLPFLKRKDMVGIWKVCMKAKYNRPFPNPSELYKEKLGVSLAGYEEEVVVRLNDDGTFDPYTLPLDDADMEHETIDSTKVSEKHLHHLLGLGGVWEYRDHDLLLAAHRPQNADPLRIKDMLFRGKPEAETLSYMMDMDTSVLPDSVIDTLNDIQLTIPQGQIISGKFLYPPKHSQFFEEPVLIRSNIRAFFFMKQQLGHMNAEIKKPKTLEEVPDWKFQPSDFYNRTFYLAASEHPVAEQHILEDKHCNPEENPVLDVRVLEVTFFPNNTFAALGTEKILRGKFGITGRKGDHLWLQVSIFGAGRSVSGSVYSEGRLVDQQDKRGYLGPIVAYPNSQNETVHHIYGDFYQGMYDLEKVQKHQSDGTFVLQEVKECEIDFDDDDNDLDEEEAEIAFWRSFWGDWDDGSENSLDEEEISAWLSMLNEDSDENDHQKESQEYDDQNYYDPWEGEEDAFQ